jgi:phospholipase/lecithinase/hemolysin/uncharacterized protein YhjY with autotransporter beta-barrel domain
MTAKRSLRVLGASLAFLIAAGPAHAQRVDRIVAFGDSYADDGNLFQILGFNPAPSVYPTGRFSGGTNYVDTLSQILGVPVENFAIGGALTGNVNTNGPGLPGFPFEYTRFLAGGGGVFPTVTPTFNENDLVTISLGGNDARFYQQNGGTLAGASAAAGVSVNQATVGLNALVSAGAPTISFLAGNTAILPEVAGNAAARDVRNAYSTTFNTGIQSVLSGYAASGVTVHYLDLTTIAQQIVANPQAYGLSNAGVCAPAQQCVIDSNYANQFLFYVDGLHLTSAGFAIVARYVAAQLQAPLTFQGTSDLGLATAQQFGRTLGSRMDLSAPRDGDLAEGLQLFATLDAFNRSVDQNRASDRFEVDGGGVTIGGSYGFGNGLVGIAANYSRPQAKYARDVAETKTDSFQVGAFTSYAIAFLFGQAHVGYGRDEHRTERAGVVNPMRASPGGNHVTAGAKVGYLAPVGGLRLGPVATLDYARAKIDGYTEEGDPALNLNVQSVSAKALTGGLGAEVRGDFSVGGSQLRPFASLAVEKDLTGDGRTIRYSQTSAPTIVNHWELDDRSKQAYGRLSAGASAAIAGGFSLDTMLSSTIGRDEENETAVHVGLRMNM